MAPISSIPHSPASITLNKFHVSRLGRKLTIDDQKVLIAQPRDVIPERTWAEVLQKEDNELIVLEMREEIVEDALRIGFERYMERQTAPFTAHCAEQAWLKLVDWHFYRHDPGEEPSAYPPTYIPKRVESWTPDEMAAPSPKDSWGRQNLAVVEEVTEEPLETWPSSSSLDVPEVEEIPRECWFPGKVLLPGYMDDESYYDTLTFGESVSTDMATESELLQKVTDYTPGEEISGGSTHQLNESDSLEKATGTTEGLSSHSQGGGDSAATHSKMRSHSSTKSKIFNRSRTSIMASRSSRSRAGSLPPIQGDSRSRASAISDCRLRGLRLDTQYEISSEKIDSVPKLNTKRK